jgi:integrase
LWAGVTLSTADLPDRFGRNYPFEMLGAVTMTWLFGGLRADELVRLRLGCIRWQREEEGAPASCLLDVPVNKTGPAFTKPVDPLLGHAVSAWETVRPAQPPLPDRKTGEHVNLLFAYRHRRVSTNFINDTIIPSSAARRASRARMFAGESPAIVPGRRSPHSFTTPRNR